MDHLPRSRHAYAEGDPTNRTDPTGLLVTGGCFSVSAQNAWSVDVVTCVLTDDDGNIAMAGIGAVGLGSPSVTAAGGILISNADTVEDLRGGSICISGTAGAGPMVSLEGCAGMSESGVPSGTWSMFVGAGFAIEPGGEAHATASFTTMTVLFGPALDEDNWWNTSLWMVRCPRFK